MGLPKPGIIPGNATHATASTNHNSAFRASITEALFVPRIFRNGFSLLKC